MNNDVNTLRKQLQEAEKAEAQKVFENLASKAKSELHNRCFIRQWRAHSGAWNGIVTISAVKFHVRVDRTRNQIRIESDSVVASTAKHGTRAKWREGVNYVHDYGIEIDAEHQIDELKKNIAKEITKKEFDTFCRGVDTLGASFGELMAGADATTLGVPEQEDDDAAVDLPTVQLESYEACYAKGWFLLPDYRMILTPSSRAAVLRSIRKERQSDARISHLLESCDMNYIERKTATLASLEKKVS